MPVLTLPDGAGLSYADDGLGSPIVLVHGWAASGAFFRDLAGRLARQHRVITPTLRAHPGSDAGSEPLTIETLSSDVAALFEALDLKGAVALGWSMGAMALWGASARLGPRLTGLVVEDMSPCVINDGSWTNGIANGYAAEDVASTLAEIEADWPAYVARFAPRMFASSAVNSDRQWAADEMSKADATAMAAFWRSMTQQDFRAALTRITTPTLVIRGGESQVYPDGATAFVAQAAPNARRAVLAGAGHVPHLEAPEEFFNQIEAFVRETRRAELKSGGAAP